MTLLNQIIDSLPPISQPIEQYYHIYPIFDGKKTRVIEEPIGVLKELQAKLVSLFELWKFHPSCMARKGRGIIDNAQVHIDAEHILRVDIRKCYPSVTKQHIEGAIQASDLPDNIKTEMLNALPFCVLNQDGREILPTGAPTSPILCNIALTPVDYEIAKLANKEGYIYTRYIDDIHLSTKNKSRKWELINIVSNILNKAGYRVNGKKTRWFMPHKEDKTIITGVRLNGTGRVPRDFKRVLRAKLNNLAKDKLPIDKEAMGCLAYVKSIDKEGYNYFINYYNRRLSHVQK